MSRASKYDVFHVSFPYAKLDKCLRDVALTRDYVIITCPHCNVQFGETTVQAIVKMKSTHCAKHLLDYPDCKCSVSTTLVTASKKKDEVAQLRAEMDEMKQQNSEMKQEIKGLQDKTCLYDSVLEAVMPSLVLPLTAPEERAKLTLREAAIKDITPLALPAPVDVVPKEMHTAMIEHKNAMIEQKDAMIAVEKERREELKEAHVQALESYKKELQVRDSELAKTMQEKEQADKRAQEANKTATSLSTRVDRLQKERDAINAKYNAALKGHEQSVRNHGKHGLSPLSRSKIGMRGCATDAEAEEARAMDRAYAQVEREREAQKRAQKDDQKDGQKDGPKRARQE